MEDIKLNGYGFEVRTYSCADDFYRKNRETQVPQIKKRTERYYRETLDRVRAIKLSSGCKDCGYAVEACALQFDHLPGYEKVEAIAVLVKRGVAWKTVLAEIEKCEVVCANCHSIRTLRRRSSIGRALRFERKGLGVRVSPAVP